MKGLAVNRAAKTCEVQQHRRNINNSFSFFNSLAEGATSIHQICANSLHSQCTSSMCRLLYFPFIYFVSTSDLQLSILTTRDRALPLPSSVPFFSKEPEDGLPARVCGSLLDEEAAEGGVRRPRAREFQPPQQGSPDPNAQSRYVGTGYSKGCWLV